MQAGPPPFSRATNIGRIAPLGKQPKRVPSGNPVENQVEDGADVREIWQDRLGSDPLELLDGDPSLHLGEHARQEPQGVGVANARPDTSRATGHADRLSSAPPRNRVGALG